MNQATFLRMMSAAIDEIYKAETIENYRALNIEIKNFPNAPQEYDNVTEGAQLQKADYVALARATNLFMKGNGYTPTISGTKYGPLSFYGIIYTFSRILSWWMYDSEKENPEKTLPNFVVLKNIFKAAVAAWDGIYREQKHTNYDQPDKYSCGSNTAANILSTWGIVTSDQEMRRYCKTDTGGTDPEDLMAGVVQKLKDSGFKNSWAESYNTSDLGNLVTAMKRVGEFIQNPNYAVAILVNTGGKGWKKYYTGAYEHWVQIVEVNPYKKTVLVNDPARTATLEFTYDEFYSGVLSVSRKSWYAFAGFP